MKRHRKHWFAIGPVILAMIITVILFVIPHRAPHYSRGELEKASVSMSTNVFKGQSLKTQALNHGYVPFFGSSELARLDLMHPSALAEKYHRSYRPFLLGKAGTQSLPHYFAMQDMTQQLNHKKAIFIISPQWFTKVGQNKAAFSIYYSPLATVKWLLHAQKTTADRYAAKRLLQMGNIHRSNLMGQAASQIAHGKQLTTVQRTYLQLRLKMLQNEDRMFAKVGIKNKLPIMRKNEKHLPRQYSFDTLDRLAEKIGRSHTNSNRFQINNRLYQRKLSGGRIKRLKNKQVHFDYRRSPEYSDFQLILNQFAESHTDVLFIMPPVNAKWSKYTGLSMPMLKQTNAKIKRQLTSQGFNHVLDLTQAGHVDYFMQDTIHLGWRGWLAIDQVANPFLTKKQPVPHYHLNNSYYSKHWQQRIIN